MIKLTKNKKNGRKEHSGSRRNLTSALLSSFSIISLFNSAFVITCPLRLHLLVMLPISRLSPDFLQAIIEETGSIKDQGELEEIAQWEMEARERASGIS